MTETEPKRMLPQEWYRENEMGFWDVFDMDYFTPTLDGFRELTTDEAMFALTRGVILSRPMLASYLIDWWRANTLIA